VLAIAGRTMSSARPWVTRIAKDSVAKASSESIWRAISAARTSGGTTMFQQSVRARKEPLHSREHVARAGEHAAAASPSGAGPRW
jgi:hypothetical protein